MDVFDAMKFLSWVGMERQIVQILVLVATIQTRYNTFLNVFEALKAVVEKVSLNLANMQGLVGPKLMGKPL
jgi:hypothetical protein